MELFSEYISDSERDFGHAAQCFTGNTYTRNIEEVPTVATPVIQAPTVKPPPINVSAQQMSPTVFVG